MNPADKGALNRRQVLAASAMAGGAGGGGAALAADTPAAGSNFGKCPDDPDLRAAWGAFCDQLKAAGDVVFKDLNPATPLHRVDGFRYLTQNLSQAFDLSLETRNTKYPALHLFCSPTRKLGSDNADCIYMQAWIDGESVYRISGKKGGARMWNVAVQGQRSKDAFGKGMNRPLHDPFGDSPQVNIFGDDLQTNWDGSFELYIGGPKQGQNWLPTNKDSRKLFLRQYFDSWDEEPGDFRIERVGMDAPRPIPTPQEMIEAMRWSGQFCQDVVREWPEWEWEEGSQVDPKALNQFRGPNLTKVMDAGDLRRGRLVTMMRWGFENDEALILEFDASDAFWMITNEAVFGNSMDFLYRPVSYTPSRTAVDADGKIRLVMTARDPGFANWIDNQGYTAGMLTFRNIHAGRAPVLRTEVVKFSELARHMRSDAKRSSPQDRTAELQARFYANRRRYRL